MRNLIALLLLSGLSPAILAQTPVVGESAVQTVHLQEGWNWVGLFVLPGNTSMESVLGSAAQNVLLVKNDEGQHYSEPFEISDLDTWTWNHAFAIRASQPATIYIGGQRILADQSPISLRAGWNLVPHLATDDMPIEEALASIWNGLEMVRDREGRVFEAGNSSSNLDTLRTGQGYLVRVSGASSLVFPPSNPPDTGGSLTAPTIPAALALSGLEVGQVVNVLGYHAPGDGGGGVFVVEASNAEIDNGVVFVPNEYLSTQRQVTINRTGNPVQLPHQHIVPGTVHVDARNAQGTTVHAFDGRHLHGHRWVTPEEQRPMLRYGQGVFEEHTWRLWWEVGEGGTYVIQYRHATSNIRLVRQGSRSVLNMRHYGARSYDEDPAYDVQPLLGHVINRAKEYGSHTVLFPDTKTYEYYGSINIPDGLTLAGAAGTELLTVTDDQGNTFQPVRIQSQHTRLRVKSGEALKHLRMDLPGSAPGHLPPDIKFALDNRKSAISLAGHATSAGLRQIVLDGNWEGNEEPFQNMDYYGGFGAFELHLRNTPSWAGFISTSHNGVPIPPGQAITLENVAIIGYGSNGILGYINNVWYGTNVLLGNSLWNHVMYNTGGYFENLTLTGFAWSHVASSWGEVTNLVYENLVYGPYRHASPVQIRLPDASTAGEANANGWNWTDGTPAPAHFKVDGFYFDGRGSGENTVAGGIGPNVHFKNGIVVRNSGHGSVHSESGNGYQTALYHNYVFDNIHVQDGNLGNIFDRLNVTNSVFRNINVTSMPGIPPGSGDAYVFSFRTEPRAHPSWNNVRRTIYVENFNDATPKRYIMQVDGDQLSAPIDIFVRSSTFNNQTNGLFVRQNNQGHISGFPSGTNFQNFRVYMKDVHVNFAIDTHWNNKELFLATTYMQNVTAANSGLKSEDSGTISFTASGGESHVNIPTSLFWIPEYTAINGASSLIQNFEYVYPETPWLTSYKSEPTLRVNFAQPLSAGQTVNFSWEAAVRPFPAGFQFPEYPE